MSRPPKRQRLCKVPDTPMFVKLATSVGDGRCHVAESQEWALAAVQEGAAAPATVTWSTLGNDGQSSNTERDLFRWFSLKSLMNIEPYVVWLPRDLKNETELRFQATPMLAPHEILHMIFAKGEQQWVMSMIGADLQEGVDQFWEMSSREEWFKAHPGCRDREILKRTIPLVFHIDGVEVYSGTEANVWSMSSALTTGHTHDIKIPLLAVMEEEMSDRGVRQALHQHVVKFLAWSLTHCATGKWPIVGVDGETFPGHTLRHTLAGVDLAGGWRAIMVGIKCDGKMKVQTHGFSRWFQCRHICESCMATQNFKHSEPLLSYGNLHKSAPWRMSRISHRTYLLTEPMLSPWTQVDGFHLDMVWRDFMHVFYLGVGQDLGGAVIYDLVVEGDLRHAEPRLGLKLLYQNMKSWCTSNNVAVPPKVFSMSAIGRSSSYHYPCLSSEYKASHVKVILAVMQFVSALRTTSQASKFAGLRTWMSAGV